MSRLIKSSRIHWVAPALGALLSSVITPARAADGYWLDQYNALLYLASFQLDRELEQMQRQGAGVGMVHADSLPDPLLRGSPGGHVVPSCNRWPGFSGRPWPICAGLVP